MTDEQIKELAVDAFGIDYDRLDARFTNFARALLSASKPAAKAQMQAAEIIKQWIRDHESELNFTEFSRIDASLERLMMHLALAASPAVQSVAQDERGALLPCPFCGDQAEYKYNAFYGDDSMAVCRCCGAQAFWRKWQARAASPVSAAPAPTSSLKYHPDERVSMKASEYESLVAAAAPAQSAEPVALWQSRVILPEGRRSEWVEVSYEGVQTIRKEYADKYEVRALYASPQPSPTAVVLDERAARYIVIGYGETDHPQAAFVNEREQLLDAVLGMMYTSPADADEDYRAALLKDIQDEDEWSSEGIWRTEFEIGGIVIYDLGASAASPQPVAQPVEQTRALSCWSCNLPYSEERRREEDGHCPHCGVEIHVDDDDARPASGETE